MSLFVLSGRESVQGLVGATSHPKGSGTLKRLDIFLSYILEEPRRLWFPRAKDLR